MGTLGEWRWLRGLGKGVPGLPGPRARACAWHRRGREMGGAESLAGPVTPCFYLRSQQPYPPPALPVPCPSHGRELCECLGAWGL